MHLLVLVLPFALPSGHGMKDVLLVCVAMEVGLMGCFIPGLLGAVMFAAGATTLTLHGAGYPDVLEVPRKLYRCLRDDPRLKRPG